MDEKELRERLALIQKLLEGQASSMRLLATWACGQMYSLLRATGRSDAEAHAQAMILAEIGSQDPFESAVDALLERLRSEPPA